MPENWGNLMVDVIISDNAYAAMVALDDLHKAIARNADAQAALKRFLDVAVELRPIRATPQESLPAAGDRFRNRRQGTGGTKS